MRDPECCRDCKHRRGRGTAVIQRKYLSSEVNKSIAKAIIDQNVPRWFTTKLMLSRKPKLIRSVTSDGLTNIYKRRVSLNIYKKGANKFGRKIGFKIENESEDQNQSSPKLIGILTVLWSVFDFYAGPSARGRQLYCRACNFKSVSALWAGNFYTCHVEPNGVPLSMDTDATRFYSKDIHLVMIQTNTRQRCVPS